MKFWIVLCLTFVSTTVFAEDFSAQIVLNQQGAKAAASGDYKTAIKKFTASLEAGPLNITYLNLGRALQKTGDCSGAYRAFEQVDTAPKVDEPAPEQINSATQNFLVELVKTCPATITFRCAETATIVGLSVEPNKCNTPIEVPAGKYTAQITDGTDTETVDVILIPGDQITKTIKTQIAAPIEKVDETRIIKKEPISVPKKDNTLNIILYTGAGLAFVGGVLLDGIISGFPAYASDGELSGGDFIPVGLYVLSAGLLTAGFVF